jgi:PAS domain S-box-containing protein
MSVEHDPKERRDTTDPRLLQADDLFLKAFHLSPSLMAVSTIAEGRYLMVNQAFAEKTGYSCEEIVGRTSRDLNIFVNYADRSAVLEKLHTEGTARDIRADIVTKDGAVLKGFFCAEFVPFQGQDRLLTIFTDLTAAPAPLQALAESEERYRTLAESSPEMIYVIDKHGVIQYVNPAGLAHFPGGRAAVVGKHVRDVYPPALAERHLGAIGGVLASGRPLTSELLEQFPTGPRWIDARLSPIRDAAGTITGILGMSQDITERKQAEVRAVVQRDLAIALLQTTDLREGLGTCLASALLVSGMDSGGIYLRDPGSGAFHLVHHQGLSAAFVEGVSRVAADSPNATLVMTGKPIHVGLAAASAPRFPGGEEEGLRCLAAIPLSHHDEVIGCLNVASHSLEEIPAEAKVALETVVAQIGSAVARLRAIEALHEKTAELDRFFNMNPDLLCIADTDGFFRKLNPAWERTLGYALADLEGKPFLDFVHPDDRNATLVAIAELAGQKEVLDFVNRYRCKDGSYRWIEWRSSPHGKLIYAAARDITGKIQAEEALTENEAKYRSLFETSQDAIFVIDRETKQIIGANQAACRLYGYSLEELLHMKNTDVSAEPEQTAAAVAKAAATVPLRLHRKKDGTVFPVEIAGGYFTLAGRPLHTAFVRDITDRQKAEQSLRESEERSRAVFEQASVGIAMADRDFRLVHVNAILCAMLGYSAHELTGMTMRDITHPDDLETDAEEVGKLRRNEIPRHNAQKRYLKKSGATLWGELSLSAMYSASGDFLHYLVVLEDISARKRAEEELQRAEKIESLKIFAGGIAHDFNNLLGGIFGYFDLVRQELPKDHQAYEYLDKSFSAFERAKGLARQMLTFAKGGAPIKKAVRLPDLLRDSCQLALSGSNIRCDYRMTDDLWGVDGDEHQLAQVFSNLVLNAWQAMPEGGTVTITAENRELETGQVAKLPAGRYVAIAVRDEGIGIPEKIIDKVFDPFFTTKQRGSGLGLATSYSIVTRHGGHISVTSRPAEGSVFTVFLPASTRSDTSRAERAGATDLRGTGRVLVMDDERVIREMVRDILTRHGYEVAVTADGKAAVEAYGCAVREDRSYDLVILDLTVPGGMGGAWTLRELKKIDPQVVAIVSSGYSDNAELTRFDEYGFAGMVAKPYRTRELLMAVKEAVGKSQKKEPG